MILLTGASGFIGEHLLKTLETDYKEIVVLEHNSHIKYEVEKIRSNLIDINGESARPFSTVIHLAAKIIEDNCYESFKKMINVNVDGLHEILKYAKKCGAKRFIFLSSMMVYKEPTIKDLITNKFPLEPKTYYGITKLMGELLVQKYCMENNIEYIILRPSYIYGLGQNNNYIVEKWISDALHKRQIEILNKGNSIMNMIYVKDLANVIKYSISSKKYNFATNIVSNSNVNYMELANYISKIFGDRTNIELIEKYNPNYKQKAYIYEYSNTLNEWGIDMLEIEEGLRQYKLDLIGSEII